jgi:transcriptional regulator GlxA family with amidase domain
MTPSGKKTVAILVFDDVEVLDFAGPFEVFAVTDELRDHRTFQVVTLSPRPGTVRARNGLKVIPDYTLESVPAPDILIIPGGAGARALLTNAALLEWIRIQSRRVEALMSVCTGALVLAQAGLLDRLTVTTHASALGTLATLAPKATVDASRRFHDNGLILTSAGISAGIDCSLHLVARLLGEEAGQATADYMEYHRAD